MNRHPRPRKDRDILAIVPTVAAAVADTFGVPEPELYSSRGRCELCEARFALRTVLATDYPSAAVARVLGTSHSTVLASVQRSAEIASVYADFRARLATVHRLAGLAGCGEVFHGERSRISVNL